MSIQKKEYELSVWSETLGENGQKIEKKQYIIGAHDMTYLGRAAGAKLITKINGTHELTFEMPDKFFDSKEGKYVDNEFTKDLFNERKIKLKYKNEWYEFYIKTVNESKKHKSFLKTYTCSDSFIDELSRNGYGIIFDTELYNNVEEIGTFTEEILDDSLWEYTPEYNWGDFTEFLEEKLFKIPVSIFGTKLKGHKINYKIDHTQLVIKNNFNNKKRCLEMGDDLARKQQFFWDQKTNDINKTLMPLISAEPQDVENDGYIYIPYSQLDFCYKTTKTGLTATEQIQMYDNYSYAIAPNSVDPTHLIQFIAIPVGAEIEIDESGLIVNKDYSYVMTVEEWNNMLEDSSQYFYEFLPLTGKDKSFLTREQANEFTKAQRMMIGNWCIYYDGYLDKINDIEVLNGKKISISDRTAINISPEIDQYITVYNNHKEEYDDYYINLDGLWKDSKEFLGEEDSAFDNSYTVCSKTDTRQIIPQLARNLIQNGININGTDGWEIQQLTKLRTSTSAKLSFEKSDTDNAGSILFTPAIIDPDFPEESPIAPYNTFINFGLVAQEVTISPEHYYCFGIKGKFIYPEEQSLSKDNSITVTIAKGGVVSTGNYSLETDNSISFTKEITKTNEDDIDAFFILKSPISIQNPYFAITAQRSLLINEIYFFEAYTKGIDQFDDENAIYKYSGRDLISSPFNIDTSITTFELSVPQNEETVRKYVIFENDVMPGDTYEYKKYFIQQLQAKTSNGDVVYKQLADTFNANKTLSPDVVDYRITNHLLPFSSQIYTENDLTFSTKYIDLNKCKYYKNNATKNECDCSYKGERICMYQKYGYCPYLFQTEKHCRKIRTLTQSKSNRFNLTQELSKVFEIYPIYYIEHDERGKVKTKHIEEYINPKTGDVVPAHDRLIKRIFYITEKGIENKLGFRYELNLSNISRTIKSDQIVTKLYVEDTDSSLSKTGMCSIKTAEDNPSKDSFIIDFSYYTTKGILDLDTVTKDLYGTDDQNIGYLKQLGHFNKEYDLLSDAIINLSSQSYIELEANVDVNFQGIETSQKQLRKFQDQADKYYKPTLSDEDQSQTWKNYQTKISEQTAILNGLIKELLCNENNEYIDLNGDIQNSGYEHFFDNISVQQYKETDWVKLHKYRNMGMLGQFNTEFSQIESWKKQQATYLKEINKISLRFFQKYEPYLKEGTWSDSNYLTDNAYYFGAKEVAAEGAIPKVDYSISVIALDSLPEYKDYTFNVADTTYIEDEGMFGINPQTGLPNRLKVIISELTDNLDDEPKSSSIKIQNFTTQFEDLFKQVTASVQSLTYNEKIYKRASNFTANQSISEDSLQGTLNNNNVTLINTQENNIEIDKNGQQGSDLNNHSNKYKLNGQGLFFSNNGGQSWNVGVGPGGINADYIKVGSLDAGKVRIVDNDYLYFYWDKEGIVALKDPANISDDSNYGDYTIFNRHGLSVVQNDKIKLRSGYSYVGTDGKYNPEDKQGQNLGFFLYDNNGKVIFNTSNENQNSAALQLKGEIQVGDSLTSTENIQFIYDELERKLLQKHAYQLFTFNHEEFDNAISVDDPNETLTDYCISAIQSGEVDNSKYFEYNGEQLEATFSLSLNQDTLSDNYFYFSNKLSVSFNNQTTQLFYTDSLKTSVSQINIFVSVLPQSSDYSRTYPYEKNKNYTDISYYEYTNHGGENRLTGHYYIFGIDEILYYNNITTQSSPVSQSGSINVYVNNQAMGENAPSGYNKRIFSCLKMSEYATRKIENLFTILDNGDLYIGGFMEQPEASLNVSNWLTPSAEGLENTIRINNGKLYIGSKDIMGYFEEEIEQIGYEIANLGLIPHYHEIDYDYTNPITYNVYDNNPTPNVIGKVTIQQPKYTKDAGQIEE